MGRSLRDKLFRYVKDGRVKRLKSTLSKNKRLDLDRIVDEKQRSLLHIACLVGEPVVVKVLLDNGASMALKDYQGNTPLHLALKYALQVLTMTAFDELVAPLLRIVNSQRQRQTNDLGETPRTLKKKFKRALKEKQRDRKMYEEQEESMQEEAMREREWSEKLFFEMGHDENDVFTNFVDLDDYGKESYNEWAKRISRERAEKMYRNTTAKQKSHEKIRQEKEEQLRHQTRVLEEQHQAYIKEMSQKREQRNGILRRKYEDHCSVIFSASSDKTKILKFTDIPWPCKDCRDVLQMMDMIKIWSESEGVDQKKYLRDQQIRWHPDRFLQKCGHQLDDSDRDEILALVNQISQGVNALLHTINKNNT